MMNQNNFFEVEYGIMVKTKLVLNKEIHFYKTGMFENFKMCFITRIDQMIVRKKMF